MLLLWHVQEKPYFHSIARKLYFLFFVILFFFSSLFADLSKLLESVLPTWVSSEGQHTFRLGYAKIVILVGTLCVF
jgi:hypothetical protein